MNFDWKEALEMLERTPRALESLLLGLSDPWLRCNEGEGTWNVSEVIDHLMEAEKNNWMCRIEWLLANGENKPFPPFDRFAHLRNPSGSSMEKKLFEFKSMRSNNISRLKALIEPDKHLGLKGLHPDFGSVKLSELLSTWVVHDLTHMVQIARVMAKRYTEDVGPWIEYLGILRK